MNVKLFLGIKRLLFSSVLKTVKRTKTMSCRSSFKLPEVSLNILRTA